MAVAALAIAVAPVFAAPGATVDGALTRYCEPLLAGSSAATLTETAKADGFKSDRVGAQPVLISGELIVSLSDVPRACAVQAPAGMAFAEGAALLETWAGTHPGAVRGAATQGPDGAPVRVWVAPAQKKSLLVAQQTNPRGQKVLTFILAPFPAR